MINLIILHTGIKHNALLYLYSPLSISLLSILYPLSLLSILYLYSPSSISILHSLFFILYSSFSILYSSFSISPRVLCRMSSQELQACPSSPEQGCTSKVAIGAPVGLSR